MGRRSLTPSAAPEPSAPSRAAIERARRQWKQHERFRGFPGAGGGADREADRGRRTAGGPRPRPLRVEPPRDAAHGDLSTNAAMVYAREAKAAGSNPRALAERDRRRARRASRMSSAAEVAGPGFINIRLKPEVYDGVLRAVLREGDGFGAAPGGGRAGQRRICQRQSDRPDACRPRARRGVRRRAGEPARLRRPPGDARILHQRRRRAGRRARPLRLSALPRGARRRRSARSPKGFIPATI